MEKCSTRNILNKCSPNKYLFAQTNVCSYEQAFALMNICSGSQTYVRISNFFQKKTQTGVRQTNVRLASCLTEPSQNRCSPFCSPYANIWMAIIYTWTCVAAGPYYLCFCPFLKFFIIYVYSFLYWFIFFFCYS